MVEIVRRLRAWGRQSVTDCLTLVDHGPNLLLMDPLPLPNQCVLENIVCYPRHIRETQSHRPAGDASGCQVGLRAGIPCGASGVGWGQARPEAAVSRLAEDTGGCMMRRPTSTPPRFT